MPIEKPRPTGAQGSGPSHKKDFWSKIAEAQAPLPKSDKVYQKLGEKQIRILRLHPADSSTDPIECSLEVYHTDELSNEKYDALSYTWGTEEPTQKILVKTTQEPTKGTGKERFRSAAQRFTKKRVYIRPNLEDALRRFRDTNLETQSDLLLWIDAICINQGDEKEKSVQVAMMAEIYSKAEDVLIWLGKEYNASSMAMDFIPTILDLEHSDVLISKEPKQWTALADLMKREWFSRRWVVQELVLAKNRYLYCGDKSLNWSDFERAISFFASRFEDISATVTNPAEPRRNGKMLVDIRALGANAIVDIMNKYFRWSEDGSLKRASSLESLVACLPMFESTDPRDTIYALLSIAEDTQNWNVFSARKQEELRTQGRVPFEADYSKDILEVFKDFTAFCIQTSGSLDIICRHWARSEFRNPNMWYRMRMRAENERSQAEILSNDSANDETLSPMTRVHLPSWIGLLSESPFGVADVGRSAGESLVRGPDDAGSRYHASPVIPANKRASVQFGETDEPRTQDLKPVSDYRPSKFIVTAEETLKPGRKFRSDGSLYVEGFTINVIKRISHRLFEGMIPAEWLQLAGWIKPESGATKEIPEHLWRTLVADRDPNGQAAPHRYYTALDNALTKCNSNGDLITTELIRHGRPEDMVAFLQRAQDVIWNRRFFLLEYARKSRFGLGPTKTQEGDIVCILLGCSVPVVLRKVGTLDPPAFQLIGEAFIYGMMDGEALDEYRNPERIRLV